MTNILVTGGNGYIGSHTVVALKNAGHGVISVDNFSQRGTKHVPELGVFNIDIRSGLASILRQFKIDVVVHLAASIEVNESITDPLKYYHNNVGSTISLLNCMKLAEVNNIVFASSAAVYGRQVADADHRYRELYVNKHETLRPDNPYGKSKLMCEDIIRESGLNHVILRYFNVAGATPELNLGENHIPETHLVPNVIDAILNDKPFMLNGRGAAVRDYVHVRDVATINSLAVTHVLSEKSTTENVCTGKGHTNAEIVSKLETISNKKLNVEFSGKSEGVPFLVGNNNYFGPFGLYKYQNLDVILKDAYEFHSKIHQRDLGEP